MHQKNLSSARPLETDQIEDFWLILGGHIYFQTLSTAVEFDLFTLLRRNGALSRSQIAELLNIDDKPARILLLGLTSLGLLEKTGDRYANSALADDLLVADEPGNMLPIVRWQHHINYRPMFRLHDAFKENRNVGLELFDGDEGTLYERLAHHPELAQIFQDAMQSISVQANQDLADHVDLSHVRHLVDVGGGDGSNIITLARKYPSLEATVFDFPNACEIADRNIAESGLGDRLSTHPGNCFTDPFPPGADCLLYAHFFTIWSEEEDRALLSKAFDSLPSGGSVVLFNMMQSDDETGPRTAAIGSPYFLTLATGRGMLYTWQEYTTWMEDAGFEVIRQYLPRDHGAIVGVKS